MSHRFATRRFRFRVAVSMALVAAATLMSAATWAVFRHGVEGREPGLPVLGKVPSFELVDAAGTPTSQAALAGDVWVADFIFTQCPGLCPILSAQMAKIQSELANDAASVRLVSFSVDPKNDTPQALSDYARRFGADKDRWSFLTGDREVLHALIRDGFHLAVAERPESENDDGEGLITHSDRFVLVDRDLQIRGYYHGTEEDSIQRLLRDIDTLQSEKPQS